MTMLRPSLAAALLAALPLAAAAQNTAYNQDMPGMTMPERSNENSTMTGMDMSDMDDGIHFMPATMGPYAHSREASGTAWQPDSTPIQGLHFSAGDWMLMAHGELVGGYDHQGGPRGNDQGLIAGNVMLMASRQLASRTTLGLRAMLSADPLMGPRGYPLLLAAGESADGVTPLIDRQHPHDLFMELAFTLAQQVGEDASLFVYAGLPGEPALGPPAFMHRTSASDDPLAPISHHWLDSTHISFGVVTLGATKGPGKIEVSAFRGREPDQHRWDIETPKLDSWSVRGTLNPTPNVSVQVSYGFLKSPEALTPAEDEKRLTASASWNQPLTGGNWATTLAWGRKVHGGVGLNGWLVESDWRFGANALFGRAERIAAAELFEAPSPLVGVHQVNQLSMGYVREFPVAAGLKLGLGGVASVSLTPVELHASYGRAPVSALLFARLRLGD